MVGQQVLLCVVEPKLRISKKTKVCCVGSFVCLTKHLVCVVVYFWVPRQDFMLLFSTFCSPTYLVFCVFAFWSAKYCFRQPCWLTAPTHLSYPPPPAPASQWVCQNSVFCFCWGTQVKRKTNTTYFVFVFDQRILSGYRHWGVWLQAWSQNQKIEKQHISSLCVFRLLVNKFCFVWWSQNSQIKQSVFFSLLTELVFFSFLFLGQNLLLKMQGSLGQAGFPNPKARAINPKPKP